MGHTKEAMGSTKILEKLKIFDLLELEGMGLDALEAYEMAQNMAERIDEGWWICKKAKEEVLIELERNGWVNLEKHFGKRWKIAKKAFKEFITVSKYVVLTEHKTFRIIEDVYKGLSLSEVSKRGKIPIEILFSGIKNKKLRITLKYKHSGGVLSVAFSPDGRLIATGSGDKMLRVFDLKKKEVIFEYKHGGYVLSVAFSPDGGLIATGSYDEMLRVFEFYIA